MYRLNAYENASCIYIYWTSFTDVTHAKDHGQFPLKSLQGHLISDSVKPSDLVIKNKPQ